MHYERKDQHGRPKKGADHDKQSRSEREAPSDGRGAGTRRRRPHPSQRNQVWEGEL